MLVVIDVRSGVPIFRQIIDQMRHQILTGRMKDGEAVTSVKDLAAQIKVNPMTISKAYSLLELEGYLERRRGIGMFVARPRQTLTDAAKRRAVRELLMPVAVQAFQMGLGLEALLDLMRAAHRELEDKQHD